MPTKKSRPTYRQPQPGTYQEVQNGQTVSVTLNASAVGFGNLVGSIGITFTADPKALSSNGGAYSWAQTIDNVTRQVVNINQPPIMSSNPMGPGLDNIFPYPMNPGSNNTTQDNPGSGLDASEGEFLETFTAKMYLLWTPPVASDCKSGAICTIAVPLGYVSWGFNGDAINQQQFLNTTSALANLNASWWKACGQAQPANPVFVQANSSNSYPTWTTVLTNTQ